MSTKTKVDFLIRNVNLPRQRSSQTKALYEVACVDGNIVAVQAVEPSSRESAFVSDSILDAGGQGLLIPGLCHAHIHLDKCFLLDRCELRTGDFQEALIVTSQAKARFSMDKRDLLERSRRLIMDSIASGVTAMRAHVEVDETVGYSCLQTGFKLKEEMRSLCYVQIVAFAQDPLCQSGIPNKNFQLLVEAAKATGVEVVGSAPYVEASPEYAKQNIKLMFDLACRQNLHLDFHLDYNLDSSVEPLIWDVLDTLISYVDSGRWNPTKRVCVGHATRLTLWGSDQWTKYQKLVETYNLPITLVGLPQSDVYMMGRDMASPPRSTLNICKLDREYGIKAAMAVNNVGNAFTPQGSADPLALCTLGVALFQAATQPDCYKLLESVTATSRAAIGLGDTSLQDQGSDATSLFPRIGQHADFVLLYNNDDVQSAVCEPSYDRTVIMGGNIVCQRRTVLSLKSY